MTALLPVAPHPMSASTASEPDSHTIVGWRGRLGHGTLRGSTWWAQGFLTSNATDAGDVVDHLGGIRGFFNLITRRLDDRLLVVVLTNTARMGWEGLRDLTAGIVRIIDEERPGV